MPSGYTSQIQEGKINNAKDFLMLCARAFGATVMMREESMDAPIPEFQPSNYHLEKVEYYKNNLEKYKKLSLEEAQKEIDEDYIKQQETIKKYIKERNITKENYDKVLEEIKLWQPPTEDHINLKKFAIEQIEESIKWDCSIDYYEKELNQEKQNAEQWLLNQIESCIKDIKYHEGKYTEECEEISKRNKWVKDLSDSFKVGE